MRLLKSLLILASLSTPATLAAQDTQLEKLSSLDATKQWQAVGRLNIGNGGFCTGTLIAPDLVLTAAHCMYDSKSGARAEDAEIEFLAGWREGRASAYRGVRQSIVHEDYVYSGSENVDHVSTDIALLQLDQPIRHPSIRPFGTRQNVAEGQELTVVSYAKDRSNAPSLQDKCRVLAKDPGVYVTSCDVDFGSSGSPVFVIEDGSAQIMSVVSAKAEWREQKVALTVGVEDRLEELKAQLQNSDGVFSKAQPGKRLTFQSGLQPSGARFLKP